MVSILCEKTMTEPTESELAASIAENMHDGEWAFEVPYNHYGDRGVVDMVQDTKPVEGDYNTLRVFELKSDAAVREATGPNEILRQFNRHREYFIEGTGYNPLNYDRISFELTFTTTPFCMNHVKENWLMYESVEDEQLGRGTEIASSVFARPIGYSNPIIFRDGEILNTVFAQELGLVGDEE